MKATSITQTKDTMIELIMQHLNHTVSGIVAEIGTSGSGIGIDTGVEIITVYGLGPIFFWDAAGVARPAIGEEITVNGYKILLSDGTYKIVVMSVTLGGEELVLRDSEIGAPLWRGSMLPYCHSLILTMTTTIFFKSTPPPTKKK